MTAITFLGFRGKRPRMGNRLLPDNAAQEALNLKITSGQIDPLNGILLNYISPTAAAIKTLYRYKFGSNFNWLVFGSVVDVQRSPTQGDTLGRIYWTGDGEPRMSSYAQAISGGSSYPGAWYVLGVSPPITAPSIVVVGGATPESRAYVYTFVTALAEESAPSAATVLTGNQTGSWNLSAMDVPPANTGTITAAVKDTPASGQVTATLNTVYGLQAGENLTLASVVGMTDLNGSFKIVSVDSTLNKIVVALTTTQTYTSGGTWTRLAPHNLTGMTKRIYRTVGVGAVYKFVAEIAATTTTYSDTVLATNLGNTLPTLATYTPPKDMHSLIALPNGAFAGLSGNQLCLSESYKPSSWPIANRYTFAGVGVALVALGNSIMILTDAFPFVAVANQPDQANLARINTYAPCISKRGVVDTGEYAIYPSHDGLWSIRPGGAQKITSNLYRYDEWNAINPASFDATFWDGEYIARRQFGTTSRVLFLDLPEADGVREVDYAIDYLYRNPFDGLLYAVVGNQVYFWNADANNRLGALWRSHDMQSAKPVNFSVAQVHANYQDAVPVNQSDIPYNTSLLANSDSIHGDLDDCEILEYAFLDTNLREVLQVSPRSVQFTLLANGVVVFSKALTSSTPFRLPAGYLSEVTTVQINTNVSVYSAAIADSFEALKREQA